MKTFKSSILILLLLFTAQISNAQLLDGTLVDENRKLISEEDFEMTARKDGWMIFELAVDREGNVTSATFDEGSIISTPMKIEVREELMKLKFEPGNYYPKFHHVRVKMTLITEEVEE